MRTLKVYLALLELNEEQKYTIKKFLDETHQHYAPFFRIYYSFEKDDYINAIHGDLSIVVSRHNDWEIKQDIFWMEYFGFERLLGELDYFFKDIKRYLDGEEPKQPINSKKIKKYFYYLHESFNPLTSVGEP